MNTVKAKPPSVLKKRPQKDVVNHDDRSVGLPHSLQELPKWDFTADYNDHFETPVEAYADIILVLKQLSIFLQKPLKDLIVYDPYFCLGNMVERLRSCGVESVINQNKDFYKDIRNGCVPEYDILVTNPPYSGDHKQRLLNFLSSSAKPYALLVPAYTATKSYWKDFLEYKSSCNQTAQPRINNSVQSQQSKRSKLLPSPAVTAKISTPETKGQESRRDVLYLMPANSYEYVHPEGTGKDVPPFYSCWFVGGVPAIDRLRIAVSSSAEGRRLEVLTSIVDMVSRGYVVDKRPNPKRRKKMKMLANKVS